MSLTRPDDLSFADLSAGDGDDTSFAGLDDWPVNAFSASSVATFLTCPEQFRAKYILRVPRSIGGGGVLGSAFHHARKVALDYKLHTGQDIEPSDMTDAYSDGWEKATIGRPVDWGKDEAGELKDAGYVMVLQYALEVAPTIKPAEVEVRFTSYVPDVPIPVIGYLDLVDTDGIVIDTKTAKNATRTPMENWRVQALIYLQERRTEFQWHTISRPRKTDGVCTIHTPATSPAMRMIATPARVSAGQDLVREAAQGIHHLMSTRGPDEVWPGTGILHTWACSACDHADACRWRV